MLLVPTGVSFTSNYTPRRYLDEEGQWDCSLFIFTSWFLIIVTYYLWFLEPSSPTCIFLLSKHRIMTAILYEAL